MQRKIGPHCFSGPEKHTSRRRKKDKTDEEKMRQNRLKKQKFKRNLKEKDQHTMLYFGKIFRRQLDTGKKIIQNISTKMIENNESKEKK